MSLPAILAAEGELKVLPQADELLWGSVAFLILLVVLLKFVFPKLRTGLEQRARRIQGQVEEAERTRAEADGVLQQYQRQLADARTEAGRIVDDARKAAESLRREVEARAQAEAQQILERARAEVGAERDRAMQEMHSTLADLSIQLAQRVVERELTNVDAHRALVQQAIAELAGSNGGGRG